MCNPGDRSQRLTGSEYPVLRDVANYAAFRKTDGALACVTGTDVPEEHGRLRA
jgi:hypothetical protein